MKTEDHKARYAIYQAVSIRQRERKKAKEVHYYINRNVEDVLITAFQKSESSDHAVAPVTAGRINCEEWIYCQLDLENILLVEQSYR